MAHRRVLLFTLSLLAHTVSQCSGKTTTTPHNSSQNPTSVHVFSDGVLHDAENPQGELSIAAYEPQKLKANETTKRIPALAEPSNLGPRSDRRSRPIDRREPSPKPKVTTVRRKSRGPSKDVTAALQPVVSVKAPSSDSVPAGQTLAHRTSAIKQRSYGTTLTGDSGEPWGRSKTPPAGSTRMDIPETVPYYSTIALGHSPHHRQLSDELPAGFDESQTAHSISPRRGVRYEQARGALSPPVTTTRKQAPAESATAPRRNRLEPVGETARVVATTERPEETSREESITYEDASGGREPFRIMVAPLDQRSHSSYRVTEDVSDEEEDDASQGGTEWYSDLESTEQDSDYHEDQSLEQNVPLATKVEQPVDLAEEADHRNEEHLEAKEEGSAGEGGKDEHHREGEKGEKSYREHHEHEEGEKGHHDKEKHDSEYEEKKGAKKKHFEEAEASEEHKKGEESEKKSGYSEKGKHSEGHNTKGEHSVHKKDEYEKKTEFYDEFHDSGEEEKNEGHHVEHHREKGGRYKTGHRNEAFDEGEHGKKGKYEKGHKHHDKKGHKEHEGHEEMHQHEERHGKKGSSGDGKKWTSHGKHSS